MNVTNFYLFSSNQVAPALRGAGAYKIPVKGWTDDQGTWALNLDANYPFYTMRGNTSTNDADETHIHIFLPAGDYYFNTYTYKDSDMGIMKIYVDGTLISTTDCYAAAGAIFSVDATFTLTNDALVKLSIKVDGKNGASSDYRVRYTEPSIVRTA